MPRDRAHKAIIIVGREANTLMCAWSLSRVIATSARRQLTMDARTRAAEADLGARKGRELPRGNACYNKDAAAIQARGERSDRVHASVGEWLSLVEHLVRDQGVGGSNPLSPTNITLIV